MPTHLLARRRSRPPLAAAALLVAVTALAGCAGAQAAQSDGPASSAAAPDATLPTAVPAGTKLVVGDPTTQKAVALAGDDIDSTVDFDLEWANVSGGPATTEAFRANALDVGAVADIPPIHATWTGLDVKIVAASYRQDWKEHPIYQFGVRPGLPDVTTLKDFRGKKIAYSPGQAQGAIVLRALKKAGLTEKDVTLVELPSTGDVYPTALAAKEVDIAPIGGVQVARYVEQYGKDGAHTVEHGLRDDPSDLYAPTSVIDDPAKAAALREYVQIWAQAKLWVEDHPDEWRDGYYVKDQGLDPKDAQYLVDHAGIPDLPADWTEPIARHQETIDLLAKATGNEPIHAEDIWDQRFAPVIAEAVDAYRKANP
ncbi:ABC transporter substrate-binding protein [Cellulomonas sp. URHB0016]